MKRPLAYTPPIGATNEFENTENAAKYASWSTRPDFPRSARFCSFRCF